MELLKTQSFMKELKANKLVDSYAVYVYNKGERSCILSENTDMDTYFDIASMGKILITATLILKKLGENQISLTDTLEKFFDDVPHDLKEITMEQLLTHTSGIVRCNIPRSIADEGRECVAEYIMNNPLAYTPGKGKIYSCNAYILLGYIAEKIYDMPLDKAFHEYIAKPLGLTRSRFNISVDEQNAAFSYRRTEVGEYRSDDENVYNMRGIAGSGAQFWTMSDMVKFCNAVMNKSSDLYASEIFDKAERSLTGDLGEDANGLGWLITDERYRQCGKLFPTGSFGHCGHTGTSFFFNRDEKVYVVILTNATRCLWLKNNCTGYDYGVICKMRENIHNKISEDLVQKTVAEKLC